MRRGVEMQVYYIAPSVSNQCTFLLEHCHWKDLSFSELKSNLEDVENATNNQEAQLESVIG